MNDSVRTRLVTKANGQMAEFPQYAGRFDDMVLMHARRTFRTKAGVVMVKNEVVLVDPAKDDPTGYRTIWSVSTACLTTVPERALAEVG
jgi:hypothetical protein